MSCEYVDICKGKASFFLGLRIIEGSVRCRYCPMNEERRAYQEIIAQLLNCDSNEELQQVLNTNWELVDAGLVQMMRQVAEELKDRNAADFLIALACQLAELPKIEEYGNFLMQVLKATEESKGDPNVVLYPLLQRNLDKLDEFLARVLQARATETLAKVESEEANDLAAVIVEFSNLIQQFHLGNRLSNLEIAIGDKLRN